MSPDHLGVRTTDDATPLPIVPPRVASSLESAFAEAERLLAEAAKAVHDITTKVRAAQKAAKIGDVRALSKAVRAAQAASHSLDPSLQGANRTLERDFGAEMRSGAYSKEIEQAAARANLRGVRVVPEAIVSFPIVAKPIPDKLAIQYGKKTSAAIRPSAVVSHLAKMRERRTPTSTTRARKLVDAIERAFQTITGNRYNRSVPIRDIYQLLTPLPGQSAEYTEYDFVQELYFLQRAGVLESSSGRRLSFPASTGTTGRSVIRIATEEGEERPFSSVKFD